MISQCTKFEVSRFVRYDAANGGANSGVVANIYLAERMASAEREPITGVWGQSPQRGPGSEPLVGVRGAKPP